MAPLEVQNEVVKEEMEEEVRKNSLCLNCIPGLHGKKEKQQFIVKVYGILMCMLLITVGVCLVIMLNEGEFGVTY